jgi:hypothetical protein
MIMLQIKTYKQKPQHQNLQIKAKSLELQKPRKLLTGTCMQYLDFDGHF